MTATVETGTRPLPPLGPNRRLKVPKQAERTLANGLTVIAVRRNAVPLVELRLWMPAGRTHLARGAMLAQTILAGTPTLSATQIAAELQKVGGALSAGLDPDRLMLSGASLGTGLDRMLEILADVLTGATYPGDWVETERDRLVDRIQVAQSQPAHLARTALLKRIYGRHPYAVQTPEPDQVRAVRPPALRRLHAERVHPAGAVLVLVGDVQPERAVDAAEKALAGWNGAGRAEELPPAPPLEPGPLLLVDRPGSVQSSLRIALPAVPRTHPDHAALQLANLLFGGYFSSRWVENIREDKGYTYGPHSLVEHSVAGSVLIAAAEVATEVTAPALLETTYELGRLAALPPKPEELEQARQYALGTLQLGMSTQTGLASLTSAYAGNGLRLDFLAEHASRLARATVDDVAEAAARYLAPAKAVTVVLGDAERIADSLATLGPVRTEAA
ncbi:insulinase family protein [Micromonospora sp. DR5-3]|uniref:M16 family metallopeptidase n=1 Tax=unclassified Micromonospora TaxID=2617518 RepID=UPI0011DA0E4F|nr:MULTISPECIES: pitrilysin family protein [unclassified Micromonospora]MCW3814907.1 insulinase family protein [Micromonospora sp. DR5-3]TYC24595.1 insulinase family protein [Micromonospora sp. MP36]